MQSNTARKFDHVQTHGGSPAFPHLKPIQELRRSVLSCMLFEGEFYESGQSIADRIDGLCTKVSREELGALAVEARTERNLRHVSLLLAANLAKHGGSVVSDTVQKVIQRADELSEFLSLYWRNGKTPISKQVKKGLAEAFKRFDAYSLAKYDRAKAIRLRDVLFLTHPKPKDDAQAAIWKALVDGTLPAPDTWEVALSAGADKKATFERMLRENTLGYLALLRNLRNMTDAGVDDNLIRAAILARKGAQKVLPFRYVAAARACPRMEPAIDQALSESIDGMLPLSGRTAILVDVSGSMDAPLSAKSDLKRMDAAAALASVINGNLRVFTFSNQLVEVPARRGMAGVDAVIRSQQHGGTQIAQAVALVNANVEYDRIIVITDEQATDGRVPGPKVKNGYLINVASYKNGVNFGAWRQIDGFSEGVIRYIAAVEAELDDAK